MPATKITELTAISTINTAVDPLPIVDVSDTSQASSGTTKKITISQIDAAIFGTSGSKAIVVDNVASLKALTVSGITDGQLYITRGYYSDNDGGQGTYIYDTASAASDNGGTVIAPTSGSGRFLLQYSDVLNVKQFGAKGDNSADDTTKIQAAINFAIASGSKTSCVFLPTGIYRTTSTLSVNGGGFSIRGQTSQGVISYSPLTVGGTQINFDSNSGSNVLVFGDNSNAVYGIKIKDLRISASPGVSVKPASGIRLNAVSEFEISDVALNGGFVNGLTLNACTLGSINVLRSSANDVGILFDVNTSVAGFTSNKENWIRNANIWDCDDGVLFVGASSDINFRDTWVEYSERSFHFRQDASADLFISDIQLDNVYCSTGGGGPANSRSIKGTAKSGASQSMRVSFKARNCTFYNNAATYNVEYIKGTNTGVNTYLEEAQFDNCSFIGASTSAVYSDTGNSTSSFTNKSVAYNTFGGSLIPLSSGLLKPISMLSAYGYWNMSESYPMLLPRIGSFTYAIDGQFYYENTVKRLASTSNGNRIVHSRPYVETFGDQSITATVAASGETLMFNTTLTATRTVTLSSTSVYNGAKFRVVRTSAATGAFDLNVAAGLKLLAAGQWCDVEHNGTQWVLTAYGSL